MEKYFVPYNIALALKELGFDEVCLGKWFLFDNKQNNPRLIVGNDDSELFPMGYIHLEESCYAPLYDQVIDWFIENHDIYIEVRPCRHSGEPHLYQPYHNENRIVEFNKMYKDRKHCFNAGILKAIELIKQNHDLL